VSQVLKVKKLHPDATIPTRGSTKASGLDLYALEDTEIKPFETKLVKTGIAFRIPEGFEIQVRPRSGMSLKTPLRIANSPGSVDADYLGECAVIMHNAAEQYASNNYLIKKGDRIAQAVLVPVEIPQLVEVEEFDLQTERGSQGFGSTGK